MVVHMTALYETITAAACYAPAWPRQNRAAGCRPAALRACTQRTRTARKTQCITAPASSALSKLFVFGLGYTGLAVADEVQKLGW